MMETISISAAQKITSPNPFCLIGSLTEDGRTNLAAIAWWNYVSNRMPALSVAISQKGYSNERIKATGVFTLNVVDAALAGAAMRCGTSSGRNCDKAAETGIALEPVGEGLPMRVRDSAVSFVCRVVETLEVQDHTLFVARVESIGANADKRPLFALDGYARLGTVRPD